MEKRNRTLDIYVDAHVEAVKWATEELNHRSYLEALKAACKLSHGDIPTIDKMVARWLRLEYEAHSGRTSQRVKWLLVLAATKRAHSNIGSTFLEKDLK